MYIVSSYLGPMMPSFYRSLMKQSHMHALVCKLFLTLVLSVQVFMAASLLVNCIMYISLLHVMYAVFLRSLGYKTMRMPSILEKRLLPPQLQNPTDEI
jgi:hypothetical protein